jgi:alpha-galactosidase
MMKDAVDAVVAKNRTVKGWDGQVSLCDLGYCAVGIDEGWEGCGEGVGKSQHYANGTPAVNPKFPNLKELVDYGHSKNVKMGFYQNGCACGEKTSLDINLQGDISFLHDHGFDAVKLDGCGAQRNMTRYAQLMVATGKNYSIENCHWGRCTDSDDSSCPTTEWCRKLKLLQRSC